MIISGSAKWLEVQPQRGAIPGLEGRGDGSFCGLHCGKALYDDRSLGVGPGLPLRRLRQGMGGRRCERLAGVGPLGRGHNPRLDERQLGPLAPTPRLLEGLDIG